MISILFQRLVRITLIICAYFALKTPLVELLPLFIIIPMWAKYASRYWGNCMALNVFCRETYDNFIAIVKLR